MPRQEKFADQKINGLPYGSLTIWRAGFLKMLFKFHSKNSGAGF
jgi:hypothetical protein